MKLLSFAYLLQVVYASQLLQKSELSVAFVSHDAFLLEKGAVIKAIPMFLEKYNRKFSFEVGIFCDLFRSTFSMNLDFDLENLVISELKNSRSCDFYIEDNVIKMSDGSIVSSVSTFAHEELENRLFSFSLDSLVDDFMNYSIGGKCDKLDALLVVIASGLTVLTSDHAAAYLRSSKPVMSADSSYIDLVYVPLIQNYLASYKFDERKFPDLKIMTNCQFDSIFRMIFYARSYPFAQDEIVSYDESIFSTRPANAELWNEEMYFEHLRKIFFIGNFSVDAMNGFLTYEQFALSLQNQPLFLQELLLNNNFDMKGNLNVIEILNISFLDGLGSILNSQVDLSSVQKVILDLNIFNNVPDNLLESLFSLIGRLRQNIPMTILIEGVYPWQACDQIPRVLNSFHQLSIEGEFFIEDENLPELNLQVSFHENACPIFFEAFPCLPMLKSLRINEPISKVIKLSDNIPKIQKLEICSVLDEFDLLPQLAVFSRLEMLFLQLPKDPYFSLNELLTVLKQNCPLLRHLKLEIQSSIVVGNLNPEIELSIDFSRYDEHFYSVLRDLNTARNCLLLYVDCDIEKLQEEFPLIQFRHGPFIIQKRFGRTKRAIQEQ